MQKQWYSRSVSLELPTERRPIKWTTQHPPQACGHDRRTAYKCNSLAQHLHITTTRRQTGISEAAPSGNVSGSRRLLRWPGCWLHKGTSTCRRPRRRALAAAPRPPAGCRSATGPARHVEVLCELFTGRPLGMGNTWPEIPPTKSKQAATERLSCRSVQVSSSCEHVHIARTEQYAPQSTTMSGLWRILSAPAAE